MIDKFGLYPLLSGAVALLGLFLFGTWLLMRRTVLHHE